MADLAGKHALITGAASGFGQGIARRFVAAGARVVIADIDLDAAQTVAEELGPQACAQQVDVASAASVEQAVSQWQNYDQPINVLVNNAGIGHLPQALHELPEPEFDRLMGVNTKSIYLMARALVPHMQQQGGGVILNIASTAGVSPRPNLTWYNASKGWVITATRSMAVELAASNIRVNALNPVAGETPLLSTFMGGDTQDNRERFLSTIPLGRFSTPEDIGHAACFLCSDEAAMITGVAMEVDGGRCV